MIGNDWTNDITPAGTLGMPQFWIAPPDRVPPDGANRTHPVGIGPLEMFFEWAQVALGSLNLPPPPAGALPFLLLGNAAVVTSLLEDMPSEASWKLRSGPSEWSLTEILCHLRDVDAEVNLPRLSLFARERQPFYLRDRLRPMGARAGLSIPIGPAGLARFYSRAQRDARPAGLIAPRSLEPPGPPFALRPHAPRRDRGVDSGS